MKLLCDNLSCDIGGVHKDSVMHLGTTPGFTPVFGHLWLAWVQASRKMVNFAANINCSCKINRLATLDSTRALNLLSVLAASYVPR